MLEIESCILRAASPEALQDIVLCTIDKNFIRATGAGNMKQMVYSILPQVLPTIAGVGIYRWDINIRESTILGLVGAGGIGLQLNGLINTLAWTKVSTILLVILVTVFVSEWVSAKGRGAII